MLLVFCLRSMILLLKLRGAQSLTTCRTMTYLGLNFFDEENECLLRLTWQNGSIKLGLTKEYLNKEGLTQEELIKEGLTSQVYENLTRANKMVFIVEGNAFCIIW